MTIRRSKHIAAAILLSTGLSFNAHAVPVDIGFVVDQSLSMDTEFDWIPSVITSIDTALQSEAIVTSTRYGLAGYMEGAGNEYSGTKTGTYDELHELAFVDLTATAATVSTAATAAGGDLRGITERGYHAADWARSGFNWDANAVKVVILLTDEAGDQGSTIQDVGLGSDEANLGKLLDDGGFLLNVITQTSHWDEWDDAVYDQNSSYQGLFDLNYLRNNPTEFTQQFVEAKVGEIKQTQDVPEPTTLALMGLGLAGMGFARKRKQA